MEREERERFFEQTVATIWREERVSCPHRDILVSYVKGSLDKGASDYIRFHIEEVKCPWCTIEVENIKLLSHKDEKILENIKKTTESALRSTLLRLKK